MIKKNKRRIAAFRRWRKYRMERLWGKDKLLGWATQEYRNQIMDKQIWRELKQKA